MNTFQVINLATFALVAMALNLTAAEDAAKEESKKGEKVQVWFAGEKVEEWENGHCVFDSERNNEMEREEIFGCLPDGFWDGTEHGKRAREVEVWNAFGPEENEGRAWQG